MSRNKVKDWICNMRKHNVHSNPLWRIVCSATAPSQHHNASTSVCTSIRLPHSLDPQQTFVATHRGGTTCCTSVFPWWLVVRAPGNNHIGAHTTIQYGWWHGGRGITTRERAFPGRGGDPCGVHWCQREEKPEDVNTCVAKKMLSAEKCE